MSVSCTMKNLNMNPWKEAEPTSIVFVSAVGIQLISLVSGWLQEHRKKRDFTVDKTRKNDWNLRRQDIFDKIVWKNKDFSIFYKENYGAVLAISSRIILRKLIRCIGIPIFSKPSFYPCSRLCQLFDLNNGAKNWRKKV